MICFGYGEAFTILSELLGKMIIWFAILKSAPARVATPEPEIKWKVNSFLPRIPFLANEKLVFFLALPELLVNGILRRVALETRTFSWASSLVILKDTQKQDLLLPLGLVTKCVLMNNSRTSKWYQSLTAYEE